MKANEAPKKLYISDSELNDAEHCVIWFKSQQNENDIEYIRKDVFIEKACEFIKDNGSHYIDIVNGQLVLKKGMTKDFKKYIEGE